MRIPIEETALYRLLGPEKVERLRPEAHSRRFEEGEYLYFEAQPADHIWTLGMGQVRTLRGSANGRITTLETIQRGDLFGMSALGGAREYGEACQGLVAGEAWYVPRRALTTLIEASPEVGHALLQMVADRLLHAHDRLCSFAHDTVSARMARAVLDSPRDERIETTRRLLGESAGTTVETAIRVLRRFERAGWIDGGVGWIRVLDPEALARVANGEAPTK